MSDPESTSVDTDAVVVGAGFSGLRMLIELRRARVVRCRHRSRNRRRRDLVLEPVPGRPDRQRELVLLLLLPGTPRGVDVEGALPRAAGSARLPAVRGRQVRPPQGHPLQHARRLGVLRRRVEHLERPHRHRDTSRAPTSSPGWATCPCPTSRSSRASTHSPGEVYVTGNWPKEAVDFAGKRVGVIGAGASAVQAIPVIAEQAAHLTVFQRTPNFVVPAQNHPLSEEQVAEIKADYPDDLEEGAVARLRLPDGPRGSALRRCHRRASANASSSRAGATVVSTSCSRPSTTCSSTSAPTTPRPSSSAARSGRRSRTRSRPSCSARRATPTSRSARRRARLLRDLQPRQRHAGRRQPEPIAEITHRAVCAPAARSTRSTCCVRHRVRRRHRRPGEDRHRGEDGRAEGASGASGPQTYLGIANAGFPNMFFICGPQSAYANIPVVVEKVVVVPRQALEHMREQGTRPHRADPGGRRGVEGAPRRRCST